MIFVTVGTQKFAFNRLLKMVDDCVIKKNISEKVICQSGYSTYKPKAITTISFLKVKQYNKYIEDASVIITHAGVGTILKAKEYNKPIIVVPRLKKYNEHVDDHQVQIADGFSKKGLVYKCNDEMDLEKLFYIIKKNKLKKYDFNNSNFIEKMNNIINNLGE